MKKAVPLATRTVAGAQSAMTFDRSLACEHPLVLAARDYWLERRRGRTMPARKDLDHAGMRKFIASSGLITCLVTDAAVEYQVRLAGTQWETVFGPMTGRRLSSILTPQIRARWRQTFDTVRVEKIPMRVSTLLELKPWLRAEMFLGPLSEDGGETVSMLFLCFVAAAAEAPAARS